jgi:hypothetical protein
MARFQKRRSFESPGEIKALGVLMMGKIRKYMRAEVTHLLHKVRREHVVEMVVRRNQEN